VYKRRNVRFSYPTPIVQLAVHLCRRHRVKDIAQHLGLPPATLYRWKHSSAICENDNAAYDEVAIDLANRCEQHGFEYRARLIKFDLLRPLRDYHVVPAFVADPSPGVTLESNRERSTAGRERTQWRVAANSSRSHYRFEVHRARRSRGVLERLTRARDVIETSYNLRLNCAQLAHVAGMSRHHFIRVYKQAFGESAQQHLTRVRVNHARTLLQSTLQPAALIAVAVGFDSYATLYRAFKSVTGSDVSEFCRSLPRPFASDS
jgi:AraC-like DNA-binding protein